MNAVLKVVSFLLGFFTGYEAGNTLYQIDKIKSIFSFGLNESTAGSIFSIIIGLIFGFIFFIILPAVVKAFGAMMEKWINSARNISALQLICYVVALIISLTLATLVCTPIYKFAISEVIRSIIIVAIYLILTYLALLLVSSRADELQNFLKGAFSKPEKDEIRAKLGRKKSVIVPKLLDTSVIIDGRIFDILRTGFIDGPIVIPTFVVDELQFIADSADALKRQRGRRGLDILNKIQKELPLEIIITEKNYNDIREVDSKLIRLAKDMKGKVVTNDYNLNKVAEIHGVDVLNTNDLSNAVKAVVLPGEEMNVQILKEGKENEQGIAYLDDGTMIVVENGRHLIGKSVNTVVTSVLQTSAGRLVFVKPVH